MAVVWNGLVNKLPHKADCLNQSFLPPQRVTRVLSICSTLSPFKMTAAFTAGHSLTGVQAFCPPQHYQRAFSESAGHSTAALRHPPGLYPEKVNTSFLWLEIDS